MRIFIILLLEIFVITDYTNGSGDKRTYGAVEGSSSSNNTNQTSGVLKPLDDFVANGVLDLGMKIFKQTTKDSNDKIQVISPLSIAGATALLELGANRKTFEEFVIIRGKDLNFTQYHSRFGELIQKSRMKSEKHKITVSNGVFVSKNFKIREKYKTAAKTVYHSLIESLDFENQVKDSTKIINDWVNESTEGKIKEIVGSIEPSTKAVIVSTLFFKALWDEELGVQQVIREQFYPNGLDNPSIMADMLLIEGDKYLHHKSSQFDCSLIGLNYDQGLSTMFIILPNNSTKEKSLKLLNRLKSYDIENMIEQAKHKSATILIPKFHVEQTSDIQSALQNMGLKTLFDPTQSDLSLLTIEKSCPKKACLEKDTKSYKPLDALNNLRSLNLGNPHTYVDQIVHKVVLTVDEIGTEGGAATGTVINKSGSSVLFLAQTPFLFLIRHTDTKLPLFYGAVFEPSFNK